MHKQISDIEKDIRQYYADPSADALLLLLKLAGRALAAAAEIKTAGQLGPRVKDARQRVFDLAFDRQAEIGVRP